MTQLETDLNNIRRAVLDQLTLISSQFNKAEEALMNFDEDIAADIAHYEKKVNAYELSIDSACENTIALQSPVATDLRFILSVLNMNSDLERIGDHADGIANYVFHMEDPIDPVILENTRIAEMFEITSTMLNGVVEAFRSEDTSAARKTFKMDSKLNKINEKSSTIIAEYCKENPNQIRSALFLFSVIRKLERVGDLCKNIAEDIIFYLEAKILKHKGKTKD